MVIAIDITRLYSSLSLSPLDLILNEKRKKKKKRRKKKDEERESEEEEDDIYLNLQRIV